MAIRQATIIEDLQHKVMYRRTCFLNLIQQDDRIWPSPYRISQLPAIVVADVPWTGTDEPRYRPTVAQLRHVKTHYVMFVIEQLLCKSLRYLSLPNSSRTHEQEHAYRTIRILQSDSRPANRLGNA